MQFIAARFSGSRPQRQPQWQGPVSLLAGHGDYAVKFAGKELQAGTKRPARRLSSGAVDRVYGR